MSQVPSTPTEKEKGSRDPTGLQGTSVLSPTHCLLCLEGVAELLWGFLLLECLWGERDGLRERSWGALSWPGEPRQRSPASGSLTWNPEGTQGWEQPPHRAQGVKLGAGTAEGGNSSLEWDSQTSCGCSWMPGSGPGQAGAAWDRMGFDVPSHPFHG